MLDKFIGRVLQHKHYGAITQIKKTIGVFGVAGCDYNFASAANATEQPIEFGTDIIPAKTALMNVAILCITAVAGSGSKIMGFQAGYTSGGNEYATGLQVYETSGANSFYIAISGTDFTISSIAAASKIYISGTPTANWDTLTDGKWEVYVRYLKLI